MIDLKRLQESFDEVAGLLERRGVDAAMLAELKSTSLELKEARQRLEELQATQNRVSKEFGAAKKAGAEVGTLQQELADNKQAIAAQNEAVRGLEERLDALALTVPNPPDADVPVGKDEEENVLLKTVGTPPTFPFTPKGHHEIGEQTGWLDFAAGVKLAGSRFTVLRSEAAKLERALMNYMLDFNAQRGFEQVWLPAVVSRESLLATGQLPKFEEDLYLIEKGEKPENDRFLIPTAEVPLVNLFRDEILKEEELPLKLTAYTPCFRQEAGSAGRDTRGMIRQHQFDKVELVAIATPEQSDTVFEEMVSCASDLLASLGLPHRLMQLCTGDMGFGAAKTIDLEVWLPGEDRYREISSVSNVRDFQARRGKIRYRGAEKKTRLVHTLNGSSLAVGRTLIALMENYQNEDGTVTVPDVLQPYLK